MQALGDVFLVRTVGLDRNRDFYIRQLRTVSPKRQAGGRGRPDGWTGAAYYSVSPSSSRLRTCAVCGLKDKRSSEIFAAITRWICASAVKRRGRGAYERVKS